jgi:hypothetical protein
MMIYLCLDFFWIVLVFRFKVWLISLRRAVIEEGGGYPSELLIGMEREDPMRRQWVGDWGKMGVGCRGYWLDLVLMDYNKDVFSI